MKSILKRLFALILTIGLAAGASAQNKQIIIKKEVDENGNVVSYDSTVIETSGNIDSEQMEVFKQEMTEMRVDMKQQMAEAREEMTSAMEMMRQEMKTMMDEGFGLDSENFKDLFDMDQMKQLMEEQMKLLNELFDSNNEAEPSKMSTEQMY